MLHKKKTITGFVVRSAFLRKSHECREIGSFKRCPHEHVFTLTSFVRWCGWRNMPSFSLTSPLVEKLALPTFQQWLGEVFDKTCQGKTCHFSRPHEQIKFVKEHSSRWKLARVVDALFVLSKVLIRLLNWRHLFAFHIKDIVSRHRNKTHKKARWMAPD